MLFDGCFLGLPEATGLVSSLYWAVAKASGKEEPFRIWLVSSGRSWSQVFSSMLS